MNTKCTVGKNRKICPSIYHTIFSFWNNKYSVSFIPIPLCQSHNQFLILITSKVDICYNFSHFESTLKLRDWPAAACIILRSSTRKSKTTNDKRRFCLSSSVATVVFIGRKDWPWDFYGGKISDFCFHSIQFQSLCLNKSSRENTQKPKVYLLYFFPY